MSGKSGQTLLLYTGQSSETGKWIWQDMGNFCSKYTDYYYISSTDAGSISWEPSFQEAVTKLIGDKDISTQILSGKCWDSELNKVGARKGPYAIDGTTLLSLDVSKRSKDFVG